MNGKKYQCYRFLTFPLLFVLVNCKYIGTPNNGIENANMEASVVQEITTKEDCIFDQSTQTSDFLEGIQELEGYVWDAESKTAHFPELGGWELAITRGGCDHYELSATFIRNEVLEFSKEKDFVFEKIIWITSLLDEFQGGVIKEVIEGNKVSITKENENYYYGNFMDERVYENFYMDYKLANDRTEFSINYWLN